MQLEGFSMVERYFRGNVSIRKEEAGRLLSSVYGISASDALRDFERRAHYSFRVERTTSYLDIPSGVALVKCYSSRRR